MIFPWQLSMRLTGYLASNRIHRRKRFPMVLMLEPLFRCNLTCSGCGRIREYRDVVDRTLTVEECLASVDEAGAPVVSLTGGEPLIHPEIEGIVKGILSRKRFLHLCTNGVLLERSLEKFRPNPYMCFVVHLDGLASTHDGIAGRSGVFDTAVAGIRAAKKAGFKVRTNTTIYKGTNNAEVGELFALLAAAGVDGIMISPGFSYEAVDNDLFLSRGEFAGSFKPIYDMRHRFPFYNTPVYLDFLAGKRTLSCMSWSTPTRNTRGWKSPCYLITDGHYETFSEMMEKTPWERYGVGKDPRCANCMVHCGFEASALKALERRPSDIFKLIRWNFSGG